MVEEVVVAEVGVVEVRMGRMGFANQNLWIIDLILMQTQFHPHQTLDIHHTLHPIISPHPQARAVRVAVGVVVVGVEAHTHPRMEEEILIRWGYIIIIIIIKLQNRDSQLAKTG
jgi:hypothetical protein